MDTGKREIEVDFTGVNDDADPTEVAKRINRDFERFQRDEPELADDETGYDVQKAAGNKSSGTAWFEDDRGNESTIIWIKPN
jgi:hypothetical protein